MLEDESRVHETVKCVFPWETEEEKICGYVRAEVKSELGEKIPGRAHGLSFRRCSRSDQRQYLF